MLNRKLEKQRGEALGYDLAACDNSAMRYLARLGICGLVLSLGACGSVTSPSQLTALDFSGTLDPLGQASQTFSVSKTGEMQVTLQSLSPRPVVGFIAIAIGVPSGSLCSPLAGYYLSQTAIGQQYAFSQITKGSYCLVVADANAALTASASFSVHLLHP